MADYYVNKSGNDGNAGTSAALARLTIGSGITLCSSGDTLHVGSGVYAESSIPFTAAAGVVAEADTYTVIDGGGAAQIFITTAAMASAFVLRGFMLRNASIAMHTTPTHNQMYSEMVNCYLEAISYAFYATGVNPFFNVWMRSCIMNGGVSVVAASAGGNSELHELSNSLIYGLSGPVYAVTRSNPECKWTINRGNIFHSISAAEGIMDPGVPNYIGVATDWQDNYYYNFAGNFAKINNVSYANLAAFKAAYPGYEAGSKEGVDPLLVDPANGILYPQAGSPVVGPGAVLTQIGPWSRVVNFCNAHQFSGDWDVQATPATDAGTKWARTSGGVTLVGIKFEGQGVIVSPVWDLGGIYEIKGFVGQFNETYPTDVVDYDKSDTQPNRKNLRYRVSDTSFNQNDSVISWVIHEFEEDLTAITGRFIQVELTFRTDGVAA